MKAIPIKPPPIPLNWWGLALLFIGFLACPASGQLGPNTHQAPVIEDIEVQFQGARNVSYEAAMAHVRLREGMRYQQDLVDQSIRALYETGLYENIQVKVEVLAPERIRLTFLVVPKFRVASIAFEGNERIDDKKLRKKIETKVGDVLSAAQVNADAEAIFKYYQKKGYSQAKVDYSIEKDPLSDTGQVIFKIDEGRKVAIKHITFVGNASIPAATLREQMTTKTRDIFSWFTGNGRLKAGVFQEDLDKLRDYYRNQGFLDVSIPSSGVVLDYPSPGKLDITIHIDEGKRYYVGTVTIEGNQIFTTEQLQEVLTLKTEEPCSPQKIDEDIEALQDYCGRYGYIDAFVRVERIPNLQSGNIDLVYKIKEGDKFYLQEIKIEGNLTTKSTVILRDLALEPGDVFDLVRMKTSKERLQNTRYFEEVEFSPEPTLVPGRRDLRINVKEARTGAVGFGAGFSTVERGILFVELTQSNFDLFNYRTRFQGAGQKLRVRLQLGTRSNDVLLSFEEPSIYDRRLGFGFTAYRSRTDYVSTEYNQLSYGFNVFLRKRLFELVNGTLYYGFQATDIFDVSNNASRFIQSQKGYTLVSKAGLKFSRDTRDNYMLPTRGSRYELITEMAGGFLGGNADFFRVEGRGAHWWLISNHLTQVFQLSGRSGAIMPYDNSTVPVFERYFLGGPDNLRGFKYRAVGPMDPTGEPTGGKTFAYGIAEYSFEVVNPVRFAVFYDIGFVSNGVLHWDWKGYNDDVGFGLRIMLMGAPMRIDLGWPITTSKRNNNGMRFNFSFGTAF